MSGKDRIRAYAVLLAAIYALSVGLFMVLERLSLLDALYFTTVTLTTIGYGDIAPVTPLTKLVVVFVVPLALVAAWGIGAWLIQTQVEEILKGAWRRMERRVRPLSDHVIVCGYGRLGTVVVEALLRRGVKVVVVEADQEKASRLADADVPVVHGNALEEEVLRRAGIARARAVVATFGDDTANVYVVLAVRDLRRDVEVVSAASSREAVRHLLLAGANHVISPTLVAGEMLARSALGAPDSPGSRPGAPSGEAPPRQDG